MSRARDISDGKFANNLTVDTDTLHVDAANNRVGVGTASPAIALETSGSLAVSDTTTATKRLQMDGGASSHTINSANYGSDMMDLNIQAENIVIKTGLIGVAERARFPSSGGITFNGDTAAVNALDDYEEGTWTPQISATDGIGTMTYQAQGGRYTKVGNRVSFNLYVAIASKGTLAGNLRFTLPFTVKSVANNHTVFSWWINSAVSGQRFDGDTMQFCYAGPNSSVALPYGSNGAGGVELLNAAHVQNGTNMMVGGTYEV